MHVLYSKIIITAGCAIVTVWEALLIGIIGGFLANITDPLLVWLRVDDAVGATCVHGFGGAWGMIAVGIFAKKETYVSYTEYDGVLHGKTFLLIILPNPFNIILCYIFYIHIVYSIYIFHRRRRFIFTWSSSIYGRVIGIVGNDDYIHSLVRK